MIKNTKILLVLAALVAAFASASLTQAAPANCGQGGSQANAAGSCDTSTNDTRCGTDSTATPAGARVYANTNGFEVCSEDGGTIPVEGRFGAMQGCSCIYADGGDNNQGAASGWLRIDGTDPYIHCRPDNGGPSYNSGGGAPSNCG